MYQHIFCGKAIDIQSEQHLKNGVVKIIVTFFGYRGIDDYIMWCLTMMVGVMMISIMMVTAMTTTIIVKTTVVKTVAIYLTLVQVQKYDLRC